MAGRGCLNSGRLRLGRVLAGTKFFGKAISFLGKAIPFVGKAIPFVGKAIPFVGKAIPFVGKAIPFVGKVISFLGKATPFLWEGKTDRCSLTSAFFFPTNFSPLTKNQT